MAPAVAAVLGVALAAAQGRSLGAAALGRALGAAAQAQGLLGMVDMKAPLRVGFLQAVGTFHTEEQAAGQKEAAQNPQWGREGNRLQRPQGTGLACWLLRMSRTCWLPENPQSRA